MKKKLRKDRPAPLPLRKKMAPLIAACRKACILAPPRTSGSKLDKVISIDVTWPLGASGEVLERPEGFVSGRRISISDKSVVFRYNVVTLLKWFMDNRYITWCAKDVFRQRLSVMMVNAKMELKFERMLDSNPDYMI